MVSLQKICFLIPIVAVVFSCQHHESYVRQPQLDREIINDLITREAEISSIKTRAWIKIHSPEGEFSFDCIYAAESPSMFRIELLKPFGMVAVSVATDGDRLYIINYNDNLCFDGALNRKNIKAFLPFEVDPHILTSIILTKIPYLDSSAITGVNKTDSEIEFLYAPNITDTGIIRISDIPERSISGDLDGMTFEYKKFYNARGTMYPTVVNLKHGSVSIEMKLEDTVFNSEEKDAEFFLRIPGNCKKIPERN